MSRPGWGHRISIWLTEDREHGIAHFEGERKKRDVQIMKLFGEGPGAGGTFRPHRGGGAWPGSPGSSAQPLGQTLPGALNLCVCLYVHVSLCVHVPVRSRMCTEVHMCLSAHVPTCSHVSTCSHVCACVSPSLSTKDPRSLCFYPDCPDTLSPDPLHPLPGLTLHI